METSEEAHKLNLIETSESPAFGMECIYPDYLKRLVDVTLAILILPLILPLLALLVLIVKLDSKGPAFFKTERLGKDGHPFQIIKLRTMCVNAEEKLLEVLSKDENKRHEWEKDHKLRDDPRITRVGKILRILSLDEVPQILNVLLGDMSLVGPRPIVKEEIEKYGKDFYTYTRTRPGITGLWQISGRNDTTYQSRVALDKKYVEKISLKEDLRILAKTLPVALSQKGAY